MDVAVIGLGLIGGSALRALAAGGHRVTGYDADPATRTAARAAADDPAGARWRVADTVAEAVSGAGLVLLAVPLPALPAVLDEVAGAGCAGLLTDVTSVKGPVRDLVRQRFTGRNFVGGHPMAGRETSGFAASDPRLFDGCAWVLCLEEGATDLRHWLDLAGLVTSLGARVVPATAADHDRAVAAVSHVPHLLAAALTTAAAGDPLAGTLAAGSFRDGTRVAASPPGLIAAMCGGNAAAVGRALDAALETLAAMHAALDAPDPVSALRPLVAPASAARNAWPATPGPRTEAPARMDVLLDLGRSGGWVVAVSEDRATVVTVRPSAG